MNRIMAVGSLMLAVGTFGLAQAETTPSFAKTGPCKQILAACQAAGFYYGGHKKGPNKGEYKDCMDPILQGGSVAGVSVTPDEVSACNAHKAKKAAQKAAGDTTPPPAPTPAPDATH